MHFRYVHADILVRQQAKQIEQQEHQLQEHQ